MMELIITKRGKIRNNMITQDYINGYKDSLDTLESMFRSDMYGLEFQLSSNEISFKECVDKTEILMAHISYINDMRNSLKQLIKSLNSSSK